METMPETITELEGKWVALDKETNEVMESADTLKRLREKLGDTAKDVVLFKVPDLGVTYVPVWE